jgi:uncharacterized DUF497 family protein
MRFEWDDAKSKSNTAKHGIDFETATLLWQDVNRIGIDTPYPIENRSIVIGKIAGKLWTAIATQRDDATRIISVRRARKKETQLYGQEKTRE